jgi:predicted sulfurtransferase
MLIGNTEISNTWIGIGAVVLIAIVIIIFLSWPVKKPIDTTAVMNQAQQQMTAQFTAQIKEKDTLILDYKNKLVVSQGKYTALVQRYNTLQKEKENVKAPVTNKELRDRFVALGYPPLAIK